MKLSTVALFVVIACGALAAMQYFAVWRRSGRPPAVRAATILAFAVAGSLASLEAFFGFNRMAQWTDWYIVTSANYAVVLAASILTPLLLAAGALFALAAVKKTLRIALLFLNASMLAIWLWFFHVYRVYGDVGPDYDALHWPQSAEPPFAVRFLWSWWGLVATVLLSLAVIAPTVLYVTADAHRLD